MALTTAQKVDVRRFAGYPVYGGTPSSFQSYRFFQAYGTLEYRMSNLLAEEEAILTGTYLPQLTQLENDIIGSTGIRTNLDTDQAAVWKHNKRELQDREALYNRLRRTLCAFLGVPPGPDLGDGGLQLVV